MTTALGHEHILFRRKVRKELPVDKQEREAALAFGKQKHEEHVEHHRQHDFVPNPDNPAHRLFFRPSRNPKAPRRIKVSGKAPEQHEPESPGTGLRGVRRIRVSGES